MTSVADAKKGAAKPAPVLSPEEMLEQSYQQACTMEGWIQYAGSWQDKAGFCQQAADAFQALGDYLDCRERQARCLAMKRRAETAERDQAFAALKDELAGYKTEKDFYYGIEKLERFQELPEAVQLIKEFKRRRKSLRRGKRMLRRGIAGALVLAALVIALLVRTTALQYGIGSVFYAVKDYKHALSFYNQSRDFADSRDRIRVCRYQRGLYFQENGKWQAAYQKFRETRGYLDSDERCVACFTAMLSQAQRGDVVKFGKHEAEFPEWIVLDNDGSRVTLLAEFSEARVFDTDKRAWPECELCQWLNTEFLKSYFVAYERERLVDPTEEQGGPVYLLSKDEVKACEDLLRKQEDGIVPDPFKIPANGCWLRTSSANEGGQMFLQPWGTANAYGTPRNLGSLHARPVITVSLEP